MMSGILFLHIGAHKTGSTSIQQSFFRSTTALRRHGIEYFQYNANHSAPIYWFFSERRNDYHLTLKQKISELEMAAKVNEIDGKLKEFLADPSPKKIISGEDISRLTMKEVRQLKEYI